MINKGGNTPFFIEDQKMIEVVAAVQMAGSAYNMIKNAVEKGQEVQDIYHVFSKFFDAKEQIAEATVAAKNPSMVGKIFSGSSVEAQALEVTTARFKMKQMEKELYEFLLYTGQGDFYEEMMKERRHIRQMRLQAAEEAARKRANLIDSVAIGCFIVFCGVVVYFFYLIV